MPQQDVATELRAGLSLLKRVTAVLVVVVVGASIAGWLIVSDQATETNQALCSLRADLQTRVETSQGFLRDNPDGVVGIPAATLQQSIDGQKRTIQALSTLNC